MKIEWMPFEDARTFARRLGLKSQKEWRAYISGQSEKLLIPSAPESTYKKEWKGYGDWLGTGNTQGCVHIKKNFLPFEEAREIVRKLEFKNLHEWKKYIRRQTDILRIPYNPDIIYKAEWKGMGDWLNTKNKRKIPTIKYYENNNFFKKWSRNMVYVFGLWFADGCIVEKNHSFSITLHKNDSYLLQGILKVMKSNRPLYPQGNKNCTGIYFFSKRMVKDIIKLGGKYRKSLDCCFPNIPKQYLPDFIRGVFDGDGCIYYDKSGEVYRSDICSGSKVFIDKMLEVLRKEISDFRGHISQSTSQCKLNNSEKVSTVYYMYCGPNDTRRLGNFIYPKRTKLKMLRKYDLFQKAGKILLAPKDRRKQYLSYDDAKDFVAKMKIKNNKEWRKYCISGKKPANIPAMPHLIYKKEWKSYRCWLSANKFNFDEASSFVKTLNLKSSGDWYKYIASKEFNRKLPSHPDRKYKDSGWKNMKDWIGCK